MQNVDFKFDYDGYGTAIIDFDVDGKHYQFMPTYMGGNPLNSLITGLYCLDSNEELDVTTETECCKKGFYTRHRMIWEGEPDGQTVVLSKIEDDLRIEICHFSDKEWYGGKIYAFCDLTPVIDVHTSFGDFKNKVCRETLRVLHKYGIAGYAYSWDDSIEEFPFAKFLYLIGNRTHYGDEDLRVSSFEEEIGLLTK